VWIGDESDELCRILMSWVVGKTVHNEPFFLDCLFKEMELGVFNRLGLIGVDGWAGPVGDPPDD
jgi:hypothetical protein